MLRWRMLLHKMQADCMNPGARGAGQIGSWGDKEDRMTATTFANLQLNRWRQFEAVDLDLSEQITVLTGPNGCGKTTILSILGRHFGWNLQFLSSPLFSKEEKRRYADAWDAETDESEHRNFTIGTLIYSTGSSAQLLSPVSTSAQSTIQLQDQQKVSGLHIPSHRPPPGYARLQHIPIDPKTSQQHYQAYQNFLFQSYGESPSRNPSVAMKEALIGFAVFGQGNSSVIANSEYATILADFEQVLSKLLPSHIGFEKIEVDTPDVILKTRSGRFPLEAMSGGLNAVFGIAWQIHMSSMGQPGWTVLLDEPENHLHPSMQREFLPRLAQAFPEHRFVVATHSPFIVSSAPAATVYGLLYGDARRVVSRRLSEADLSGSPNRVLREVLDVPVTMPIWVEERIRAILGEFEGKTFDEQTIAALRARLKTEGLEHSFGDFLAERGRNADSGSA